MSGESLEDNEVADSAVARKINVDSAALNEDKSMLDDQLGNNIVRSVESEDGRAEETNDNATGGEKTLTENNDGEHMAPMDLNGDYTVKLHQNTSEDEDDEDDDLWEEDDDDSDEDDEETAIDQDEASEEEETDEEDSEGDDEETAHVEDDVSKKDAIGEDDKKENVEVQKEIVNKDEKKAEDHNVEKVEAKLKVTKSNGKREKNKVTEESSKKPDTTEKSRSSTKRKGNKRVESMGMIFMCSSNTKNDCFKYMVLGQSESKKQLVEKIYPGMRLFLYDVDLRLMYGIFKARERGGYNIEPKAFKSKFPSQVRFTVFDDCLPIPEERFKKVIKENYFTKNKFDCQLNSEQVKRLCKLFTSTRKGQLPTKLPRSRKLEKTQIPTRQERSRKRRAEDEKSSRKRRAVDERRLPERKEIQYIERPRKLPRKALSPVARSRHPLSPSVPLTPLDRNLNADPYRRDPYLESRNRDPYQQDPYESRRDRPLERRDPYLERSLEPYRNGRDYLDQRNPYGDVRDPQLDHRVAYTDTRDLYSDRRIHYRVGLDQYPDSRDPYKDDRGAYIERRVYIDDPYRRDPLPERRDVYRGEEVYYDAYRSHGVLDQPLSLESSRRYEVVSHDPYVQYRGLPSNAEPLYSSQYPSRTYRL